jgi:hypothetical protein
MTAAPETTRLYQSDWRAWEEWVAAQGHDARTARPAALARYVRERRALGYAQGSLERAAAAIVRRMRELAARPEAWAPPAPGRRPREVAEALAEGTASTRANDVDGVA